MIIYNIFSSCQAYGALLSALYLFHLVLSASLSLILNNLTLDIKKTTCREVDQLAPRNTGLICENSEPIHSVATVL